PKLSDTPGEVRWQGPALGAHTDSVLAELGLDPAWPIRIIRRAT
ncbi:carnitine dehydratase, partial [Methylobacterium radiotolerans]